MALKFTQKNPSGSATGGTYDHSLLINRGLPDQHTMESITGLISALNKKYEKPMSGIPKTDLAFDVATLTDIDNLRKTDIFNITEQLQYILNEIVDARGDKDTLRQYIDSKVSYEDWSGTGGTGANDGSDVGYPLYEEFFAKEGDTSFVFTQTYRMGSKQLEVYLNGLRMVEGFDYKEVSENEILFLFPLETDDHLVVMVRAVISSGLHEEYIATEGQFRFILQNPYAIYQNILQVYRNGVLQRKGRDYKELTDYIIEFYAPLIEGDLITFHQAGSTDPIAGTLMETEIGKLKMSNATLSIQLQELSRMERLYHTDMYVDTFLTDNAFDKEESFDFLLVDDSIRVGLVGITRDTQEDFSRGIAAGTSTTALTDRVILSNTNGGSEGNVFESTTEKPSGRDKVTGYSHILMPNRSKIEIVGDKVEMAEAYLRVVQHVADSNMNLTTVHTNVMDNEGSFHSFDHYVKDNVAHVVFVHEKNDGTSCVYYLSVTDDTISIPRQLSTYADKALNPCIHVSHQIVVAFDSNRTNAMTRNIDYIVYDGNWSGIRHITSDTALSSMRPCILSDEEAIYVIYDTLLIDGINRNIQMTRINNDSSVDTLRVTTTLYDNIQPRMVKGTDSIIRISWMSKRLSTNYGVDFVFIYPDDSISGTRTVYSPKSSTRATRTFIDVDSQGITHIAVEANEINSSINNVIYSYVTETNVVTQYGNIISHVTDGVKASSISIVYDRLSITGFSETKTYVAEKSLANYLSSGFYTIEFDGLSKDTKWLQFLSVQHVPNHTTLTYEIRVSNDRYSWSDWADISVLGYDILVGQYAQVRAKLTSNYKVTPEILSMELKCQPNMIRIQTKPIVLTKDIQNIITIAEYEGDIKFFVSRDKGANFVETHIDRTTNLLGTPTTQEIVLRAEIQKGSILKSWALIW